MKFDSKRSKKPGVQRKKRYNLKNHQRHKLYIARLDEPLQEEWGIKRLPIRVDDEVRIIKGEYVEVIGKVLSKKDGKIEIEECTFEKNNGATYYVPISPSSHVVITKLGGKKMDPYRQKIIDRKEKLKTIEELEASEPVKKGGK
ncbi:MAG: 50S ribosomal protein L24 [Promethearchaeota archaeon]